MRRMESTRDSSRSLPQLLATTEIGEAFDSADAHDPDDLLASGYAHNPADSFVSTHMFLMKRFFFY